MQVQLIFVNLSERRLIMCEKKNKNDACLFSYGSNDRNIFITKEQAEEVYYQYGRYQYAKDLFDTIKSVYEDDKILNELELNDLLPYTGILEGLLRENSAEQDAIYADCCEQVISLYVMEDLIKEGKYGKEKDT